MRNESDVKSIPIAIDIRVFQHRDNHIAFTLRETEDEIKLKRPIKQNKWSSVESLLLFAIFRSLH